MTRVEHKVAIGPPIDEVFDFITDPLRFLGSWVEVTWRVTEHEPPVRSAAESS